MQREIREDNNNPKLNLSYELFLEASKEAMKQLYDEQNARQPALLDHVEWFKLWR